MTNISELVLDGTKTECHYVVTNMQGNKKNPECPFNHEIDSSTTEAHGQTRVHGKLIQHECDVKFYFIMPIVKNSKASMNKMAIICYGEHRHPLPPPRKIPTVVKETYTKVFHEFGLSEVTARRLIASPMLPILLDGKSNLTTQHISLINMDTINHLIPKERLREYPNGIDILGV